jgi:hypothetical protein
MGALVFAIVNSVGAGWPALETVSALAAAAVLPTLLVLDEWKAKPSSSRLTSARGATQKPLPGR